MTARKAAWDKYKAARSAWLQHLSVCHACQEADADRYHGGCCKQGDELVSRMDNYSLDVDTAGEPN